MFHFISLWLFLYTLLCEPWPIWFFFVLAQTLLNDNFVIRPTTRHLIFQTFQIKLNRIAQWSCRRIFFVTLAGTKKERNPIKNCWKKFSSNKNPCMFFHLPTYITYMDWTTTVLFLLLCFQHENRVIIFFFTFIYTITQKNLVEKRGIIIRMRNKENKYISFSFLLLSLSLPHLHFAYTGITHSLLRTFNTKSRESFEERKGVAKKLPSQVKVKRIIWELAVRTKPNPSYRDHFSFLCACVKLHVCYVPKT